MFAPDTITILQMDEGGGLISRREYAPDALPDVFVPDINTAFIVAETSRRDAAGSIKISRDIYSSDAESMQTFCARTDGVCIKRQSRIEWVK
jgi:hypothetical protein